MSFSANLRTTWFETNGIRLHCKEAGPEDGPALLLLHGFPEFWFSWRNQIPALSDAGFRVIAPDLRGYNLSDKPARVCDYRVQELAADVLGLIDQLPHKRATVVGHDWGGIVAWFAGMWHTGEVDKLVILNAPHPLAYLRELRRSSQLLRSWYAFFFQLPWVPERLIRMNDFAALRKMYAAGPCRHDDDPAEAVNRYIEAFRQPGALTAAINYYRAAFRQSPGDVRRLTRRTDVPTLLLWADRDRYLVPGLAEGLTDWVPNLRVVHLPHATHWIQHDAAARVNESLIEFSRPGQ